MARSENAAVTAAYVTLTAAVTAKQASKQETIFVLRDNTTKNQCNAKHQRRCILAFVFVVVVIPS